MFTKEKLFKTLAILLTLGVLVLVAGQLLIAEDVARLSDAILVIGGDHKPERMKRAAELYQQGFAPRVIISAGTLVLEGNERLVEAEVMRRQALALGLTDKVIIIEDVSKSTFENAYYSKAICQQYSFRSVLLVTSLLHSRRAKQVFEDVMAPDIAVRVQPAEYTQCAFCWMLDPSQIYVVFYEYQNWVRYWLDLDNTRAH
jgi:uncharacterized SAM-binding protein YcdF (DUF218 family)